MTKQQYLEAVAAWKIEHVERINAIRKAKLAIKEAQRARNMTRTWSAYIGIRAAREAITKHLIIRSNMKEQAHRDYLASKAAKEATL